jgi:hypothetical protein
MRLRAAIAFSVASAGLGAGLVACFDLFHSTSGILDACELDAEACGDAAPPVDFCTWEGGMPQTAAAIACTWMSTCEGTFEDNDFGECMVRALLAYDCQANPNNPVNGPTKQAWLDLLQAKSCADVDRIVFPGGLSSCPDTGTGLGCDGITRVLCAQAGARAYGENCAMWNQTCDRNQGCIGCLGCFAGTDAGACAPDASAACNGDIATSCPNGALETIDCHELLRQSGTCNPGPLAQRDPTSPCYLDAGAPDSNGAADAGDAGGACAEKCVPGNSVTTCARGVAGTFDCSSIDAGCQQDGATAACAFAQ